MVDLIIKNKVRVEIVLFHHIFYELNRLEDEKQELLYDIEAQFENVGNVEMGVALSQKLLILETKIKTLQDLRDRLEEHIEITPVRQDNENNLTININ